MDYPLLMSGLRCSWLKWPVCTGVDCQYKPWVHTVVVFNEPEFKHDCLSTRPGCSPYPNMYSVRGSVHSCYYGRPLRGLINLDKQWTHLTIISVQKLEHLEETRENMQAYTNKCFGSTPKITVCINLFLVMTTWSCVKTTNYIELGELFFPLQSKVFLQKWPVT